MTARFPLTLVAGLALTAVFVAAALLCACQAFAPAPTPRKRQLRKPAMLPDPTLSLALGTDADVATLFNIVTFVPQATCWIPMILSGCGVAKPVANAVLSTLAHLADTIIFLYLGLSVPAKTRDWTNDYSHSLTFWAILACLVGRAAHVYPLSRPVWKANFRRPTPSMRR